MSRTLDTLLRPSLLAMAIALSAPLASTPLIAAEQASSMHQIIDIRLPSGERGKVTTASREDANELSRLLRRLGDDAKRSVV